MLSHHGEEQGCEIDRSGCEVVVLRFQASSGTFLSLCSLIHGVRTGIEPHRAVWGWRLICLMHDTWTLGRILQVQMLGFSNQNDCNNFLTGLSASFLRLVQDSGVHTFFIKTNWGKQINKQKLFRIFVFHSKTKLAWLSFKAKYIDSSKLG